MRKVDPVVETIDRVVDRVLRIGEGEAGEHHLPNVGFAVAVGVFEVQDVRRVGYQHALFPAHDAGGHGQLVRKDGTPAGPAVTVRILEQDNAADFAFHVQRVAGIFNHVDPTVFVELHRNRASDVRLGDVGFDPEAGLDPERL